MKNIVFDLFDTILDKVDFDYFKGLEFLYKKYFYDITSYEDFKALALEFRYKYMMDRKQTNKEVPFIEQLNWFENHYPQLKLKNKDEIEWQFFKECRTETLASNVKEFLIYLKKWGFNISILSNSIFSSTTLKRYLREFDVLEYFHNVYSSADIIDRKPSLNAFKYVIDKENINFDEPVFYVGNSLEKDINPSLSLGFTSILRNHLNEKYKGTSFVDYNDLLYYFENNYMYINSIRDDLSTVDGPGNRLVIFLQGCLAHCSECHNKDTWDLSKSHIIEIDKLSHEIKDKAVNKKITISGGEPLLQEKSLIKLLKSLKGYDLCLYTGFEKEEVSKEIIGKLHYIKTGKYIKELRNVAIPYVGSTNQKFIDLWEEE